MSTTGGHKLRASIRQHGALPSEEGFDVGILDPHVATLAAQHEFGAGRLSERPVARPAVNDMTETVRAGAKAGDSLPEIAAATADVLREAYRRGASGPALSERQTERKRGTEGAGLQVIGSTGPKFAEHVEARSLDGEPLA